MNKRSSTAAPSGAGYVFQLERALVRLGGAETGAAVAVEFLDDVSVHKDGRAVLLEQDKHTLGRRDVLGDRSKALWRTLQIWISLASNEGSDCKGYFVVTNASPITPIAAILREPPSVERLEKLLGALEVAATSHRSHGELQSIIDSVMKSDRAALKTVLMRAELVDVDTDAASFMETVRHDFAIDPGVDATTVVQALFGWVITTLLEQWRLGQPGMIYRDACVSQCRALERRLIRERLVPKATGAIPVSEDERSRAMGRPFVNHLARIDIDREEILSAVDQFVRFGIERHRLALSGEIPDQEWIDREERLRIRWNGIFRSATRQRARRPRAEVGTEILQATTYDHYEPLSGEVCRELYMTAGSYHRLADSDQVWWDPLFDPAGSK